MKFYAVLGFVNFLPAMSVSTGEVFINVSRVEPNRFRDFHVLVVDLDREIHTCMVAKRVVR